MEIVISPQVQGAEIFQILQVAVAKLLHGLNKLEPVVQFVGQLGVPSRLQPLHPGGRGQGPVKAQGFQVAIAMAQKPGEHQLPAVPVLDAVVSEQPQQGVQLGFPQPQGKGDAEIVLPAGGDVAPRKPVVRFFPQGLDRSPAFLRANAGEILHQPGEQVRPGVHALKDLGEVPQRDVTFLQIGSRHGGRHVAV